MTAHIIFDALDDILPATLSRPVLSGLLRQEWGYEGVIVTDSMGMKAIDDNYGRGEAAVLALKAGADLVMALGRREVQEATLDAIAQALDKELDAGTVQASLDRLQGLARRYPSQADSTVDTGADAELLKRGWAQALTAYRSPAPPAPGSPVLLVAQRYAYRENVSERGVEAEALARDLGALYNVTLHAYDSPDELDWAALNASGQSVLLVTSGRHRHPALVGVRPDLHLALYNPYTVLDVDAPALITYGFRPEARAAVLAWLRGEGQATGTLPFSPA